MAIYKVQDPSGREREIEGPDGASDEEIIAQAKSLFSGADEEPKKDRLGPNLQTAIRSTAKGAFSPVAFFSDALAGLYNVPVYGINKATDSHIPYIPKAEEGLNWALDAIGVDPEPKSLPEKMVTNALSGMTGAGAGVWLKNVGGLAADSVRNLVGDNVAANVGAGALSPLGGLGGDILADKFGLDGIARTGSEMVGSILGAMTGAKVTPGITEAGRRVGDLTNEGGWDRAAGQILNKVSSAPMTAKQRLANEALVAPELPGSRKTLAEVTQDPGLARAQRTLSSSAIGIDAGADQVNAIRQAEQDAAIRKAIDLANGIGGKGRQDRLDRVTQIRQGIVDDWNKAVGYSGRDLSTLPVGVSNTENTINALRSKYDGNDAITAILDNVASKLALGENQGGVFNGATMIPNNPNRFSNLWGRRQGIDDLVYEKLLEAAPGEARWNLKSAGQDLRTAMNQDLKATAREHGLPFEKFLDDYSRAIQLEQSMKAGRELFNKTQNTGRNMVLDEGAKYGDRSISGAKMDRLDLDLEQSRRGLDFTPMQERAFGGAKEDKAISGILTSGGSPGNSNTAQNLAMETLLSHYLVDGLFGDDKGGKATQVLKTVSSAPINALNKVVGKGVRDEIIRKVAAGMLDPAEGLRLMTLGEMRQPQTWKDARTGGLRAELMRMFNQ